MIILFCLATLTRFAALDYYRFEITGLHRVYSPLHNNNELSRRYVGARSQRIGELYDYIIYDVRNKFYNVRNVDFKSDCFVGVCQQTGARSSSIGRQPTNFTNLQFYI